MTNEECLKIFNDETLPYLKLVFGTDADFHEIIKNQISSGASYLSRKCIG